MPHPSLVGKSQERQRSPCLTKLHIPGLHDANSSLLPADFRSNYRAPPIRSVDVYNIMCSLAGVQPLPNNGSWSRVECMLRNTATLAPLPPCSSCVLALALLSLFTRQISLLWSLNNVSQCHQQLHPSLFVFLKFFIWITASLIECCPLLLHCAPPGMNLTHPAFTMVLTWSQVLCCSKHS